MRRRPRATAAVIALVAAGCGAAHGASAPPALPATTASGPVAAEPNADRTRVVTPAGLITTATAGRARPAATGSGRGAPIPPRGATGGPGTFKPTGSGPLDGKIVGVDPGHNGGNFADPAFINRLIFNGRELETCDTTGTETDAGYREAEFTWHVAEYLTADLRRDGATVVLTRTSNRGVGPCVTQRAAIANAAHANAAVSIHADGGPAWGRGFVVLEPVADGPNDRIVVPSHVLGADLRRSVEAGTGEPTSDYYGREGIESRDDLAGTNLSTVPKVFVECANMRNAIDAALITTEAWQARAARAIAAGLIAFLTRR